ncbi:MAG TPA: hydroxyacid dehydrogenase [Anaerolineales bacterium]|nr:hydroxyacid dehydrogenase [Anaerolineales bacterium]
MAKPIVLITDGLEEAGLKLLAEAAEVKDCTGISAEDLPAALAAADAVIVRSRTKMTASVLEAASRLKVIGRAGIGVDSIDIDSARTCKIVVVNTPVATTTAVAEHALALILALARRITAADASMKQGKWLKNDLMGVELAGRTLGIIGVGKIGLAVARRASPFHLEIIGYDPYMQPEALRAANVEPVELNALYARADILSLHVPLTPETQGMLDDDAFKKVKPGVLVVSTSRGEVIDEAALLEALQSGRVAGAALDVFSKEPPGLTPLVAHPNVIATPHIAAQTGEAQERAAVDIATEVLNALGDQPLRWRIV